MRRPIVIERPDGVIPGLWEANETLRKLGWLLMVTALAWGGYILLQQRRRLSS